MYSLCLFRSRKGTRFHDSIGKHYCDGYKQGDVLGCLIHLPEVPATDYLPPTFKEQCVTKLGKCWYRVIA